MRFDGRDSYRQQLSRDEKSEKKFKVVEFTVRSWEDTLNLGLAYTVEPMQQTGPKISDVLGPDSCLHFVAVKFHFITVRNLYKNDANIACIIITIDCSLDWMEQKSERDGVENFPFWETVLKVQSIVSYRVAHTKFF